MCCCADLEPRAPRCTGSWRVARWARHHVLSVLDRDELQEGFFVTFVTVLHRLLLFVLFATVRCRWLSCLASFGAGRLESVRLGVGKYLGMFYALD